MDVIVVLFLLLNLEIIDEVVSKQQENIKRSDQHYPYL